MRKILTGFIALGLLLAGCAVSEYDSGVVNVSIGGEGRYIAGGASRVDEAYLGLIDEDVLYNFEELKNVQAEGDGTIAHTFAGVPVGDYTFLAILLDENEDNIAMAMDGVSVEEGLNELAVEMGPGFTMEFGSLELELEDLDDAFTVKFNDNEVTVGIDIIALIGGLDSLSSFEVTVANTNAKSIQVLNWAGTSVFATATYPSPDENVLSDASFTFNALLTEPEFMIRMESWDTVDSSDFPDEQGYKDYKFRIEFN